MFTRRLTRTFEKFARLPESSVTLALGAVFTVIYSCTLLPALHGFGDITKAQFVGRLLGTTHPPGYPLYNLLTWAVSWLPLGTLAQRINGFSAACAVGTVLLIFRLQRDELNIGRWPAFVSACAFGWSQTFWSQSVIAEVYTLNSALVAGVLSLLLRWRRTANVRFYLAACGLYALSFGNHLTVVTLLPAFTYAVLSSDRRVLRSPALVAAVLASILTCASLYLYPLWRTRAGAPYLEYRIEDLRQLADYVTGERYRSRMFAFGPAEILQKRLPRFMTQLAEELGLLVLLAPLGVWFLRRGYARVTLLLAFAGQLLWVLSYDIPDIEIYLIPVAMIATLFVGAGLDGARVLRVATVLGASGLALAMLVANARALDHESHVQFTTEVDRQLEELGEGAIIAGSIPYGPRMAYVHRLIAEGLGKERKIHLASKATPTAVAKYLRGRGVLKDAHGGERIEPGLRVFVSQRANAAGWRKAGLTLGARRQGMRQVTLRDEPPRALK